MGLSQWVRRSQMRKEPEKGRKECCPTKNRGLDEERAALPPAPSTEGKERWVTVQEVRGPLGWMGRALTGGTSEGKGAEASQQGRKSEEESVP